MLSVRTCTALMAITPWTMCYAVQAPAAWRGALGSCYTACLGAGVTVAAAANFAIGKIHATWAWRLAFAVESPPALLMLGAGWGLPDTPNSLLERWAARCFPVSKHDQDIQHSQ